MRNASVGFTLAILLAACSPTSGESCVTHDDCAGELRCIDSVCVAPGGECGACESGSSCVGGVCRPDENCMDSDGDGFGEGCSAGFDCNDSDPYQGNAELCDGRDNDCDGVADNGVTGECGDCDLTCRRDERGGTTPFDPTMDPSDGVSLDDDGALVLDSRRIDTDFIWIANSTEGTVSRLSTIPPYNEVARYITGARGAGNDPSRTSVNSAGDAYVGNRTGTALTRISVLGAECPDTNGDGAITTSSDLNGDGIISRDPAAGEMLAWGEDDCVLWTRDLSDVFPDPLPSIATGRDYIRAVAAQDVEGPDGEILEYVWVAGWQSQRIAKIDGVTGVPIFVTPSPSPAYGFALDAGGQLWISGPGPRVIGRLDTTRCIDEVTCDVPVCAATTPEGVECDGTVKAAIPTPHQPYGITVDFNQRVWIGGYEPHPTLTYDARFARYDPAAAAGSRWVAVDVPADGHVINGIAADGDGNVWGAGWSTAGVLRIDADDPSHWITVPGTTGLNNKGMAIDSDGRAWSITNGHNQAVVVTPGATLEENTVETGIGAATLVGNYTYSDMTGLQLRLATNPRGHYIAVFEGCGEETMWGDLAFDADVPAGTSLLFRARTADSVAGLESAEWTVLGTVPDATSPISIGATLMDAGVTPGAFLMIEIGLRAERTSTSEVITPRVRSVDVTRSCPSIPS